MTGLITNIRMVDILDSVPRHILQNMVLSNPFISNYIKRYHTMGMGRHEDKILPVLEDLLTLVDASKRTLKHSTVLEIGPGQTPDLLYSALALGAIKAIGCDVSEYLSCDYLKADSYTETLNWLSRAAKQNMLSGGYQEIDDTLFKGMDLPESKLSIYHYDGCDLPIEDSAIDIVWSKSVLEHVRDPYRLSKEFYRVLKPGGLMCHIIDLRDHMTLANGKDWLRFLKYSDKLWNLMMSNRTSWCNRTPESGWKDIFISSGFNILEWNTIKMDFHRDFNRDDLDPKFRLIPDDELSTSWIHLAAVKE